MDVTSFRTGQRSVAQGDRANKKCPDVWRGHRTTTGDGQFVLSGAPLSRPSEYF